MNKEKKNWGGGGRAAPFKIYLKCTQSVSLVVDYMIFIEKKLYPLMVHPLTASSQVVSLLGRDPLLKGSIWLNDF